MIVNKIFLVLLGLFYFVLIEVNGQIPNEDPKPLEPLISLFDKYLKVENPNTDSNLKLDDIF